jgi:hypothetical protein
MSPPIAGILGLLMSSITFKVTMYLSIWKLEVNLSRSNEDDGIGGVEEWSSQDDGGIFVFYSHVQDHEIGQNIAILNLY